MWFWLALGSAVFSSLTVISNKKVLNRKVRASTLTFVLFAFTTPPIAIAAFFLGFPKINLTFLFAIIFASLVFSLAKNLQLHIFKHNNLSEVYSLQAIAPITLYLMGVLFLSEFIKTTSVVALLLITVGVYLLKFEKGKNDILHPIKTLLKSRASLLYFGAILLSNLTAISEKIAIKNMFQVDNPLYVSLWEGVFMIPISFMIMKRQNNHWKKEIKDNLKGLLLSSFFYVFVISFTIWAFMLDSIALVSSIKKFEILFVLILSYIFFQERPSKYVYLGTILMLLSAILIKL